MIKDAIAAQEKPTTSKIAAQEKPTTSTVSTSEPPDDPEELEQTSEQTPAEQLVRHVLTEEVDVPNSCVSCAQLLSDKIKLSNKVKTLTGIVGRRQNEVKSYRRKCKIIQ